MSKEPSKAHSAAQLLGKRGGTATLKKYGPEQLKEWGKLGAEFGKLGGKPKQKTSSGVKRAKAKKA